MPCMLNQQGACDQSSVCLRSMRGQLLRADMFACRAKCMCVAFVCLTSITFRCAHASFALKGLVCCRGRASMDWDWDDLAENMSTTAPARKRPAPRSANPGVRKSTAEFLTVPQDLRSAAQRRRTSSAATVARRSGARRCIGVGHS